MKYLITTAILMLIANPVFAVDTTQTYTSGLLMLLFVGFCALIIVAQLIPALLALFGMTRAVTRSTSRKALAAKN